MKDIQKRFLLFLLLCIPIRIIFVLVAKTINKKYLPYCGYIGLIISIGFAYIYIFNKKHEGKKEVLLDDYLRRFMVKNFDIDNI